MKTSKLLTASIAAIILTSTTAVPMYGTSFSDSTSPVNISKSTPVEGEYNTYQTEDGFIYGVKWGGTCKAINYVGDETDIVIPKEFDGYKVTEIADNQGDWSANAFGQNDKLRSVTILADVERIFLGSFAACKNLEKVVLPDSVTEIGENCFSGCPKLSEINIPKNLENIGYRFAWDSKWLAEKEKKEKFVVICGTLISARQVSGKVKVPDNVKEIAMYAFDENKRITEVTIPGTCKGIDQWAFSDCARLKKITLMNGITDGIDVYGPISSSTCPALEKVILPPSLSKDSAEAMVVSSNHTITYYYYKGTNAEKVVKRNIKKYAEYNCIKGCVFPGKTRSLKATPQRKKIKVTWKPVSTASGYQVEIAADKKFKTARRTTIAGRNKTTRILRTYKAGRKYYIRQRAYRVVGGKRYYGDYTKTRVVRAK